MSDDLLAGRRCSRAIGSAQRTYRQAKSVLVMTLPSRTMRVPVVQVRVMAMLMHHRRMVVGMGVRFLAVPLEVMLVLVMFVVNMRMSVVHRIVLVKVAVLLGQVQP